MDDRSSDNQRAGANASALCHCNAYSRGDAPSFQLTLWPHRSLGRKGQGRVLWLVAAGLAVPILPMLLRGVALFMLVFAGIVIGALAFAFRRNMRDGYLREDIAIWPDLMAVSRQDPDGHLRHWCAHPRDVRLHLDANGPPENYLTLTGGQRRIELGAFLTPEERLALRDNLDEALRFSGLPR